MVVVVFDCTIGGRVGDIGDTGEFWRDELRIELRNESRRCRSWSVEIAAAVRCR